MKSLLWLPALLVLASLAGPARATDLTKVDRAIGKEPAYDSKSPRYCLLVFGPQAKTRVWLVLDGDTLYIDRNGNGDLTEKDEKVALPAFKKREGSGPDEAERQVQAGSIQAGPKGRLDLMLMQMRIRKDHKPKNPEEAEILKLVGSPRDGLVTGVIVTSDAKALKDPQPGGPEPTMGMAMVDHQGVLEFADRPQTAPIIHFDGPLQMGLHLMQKLEHGRDSELSVGIGTPGLGKGTFVMRSYQGVPQDVYPVVDLELPHKDPGKEAIKLRVTLKERC